MAKPEWGAKRICHNCGARYYDMRRDPIICPKCGTEFDPEAVLKSKRAKAADRIAPTEIPEADDQLDVITDDLIDADETEEEEVIEDTSELGEDDEDVSRGELPARKGQSVILRMYDSLGGLARGTVVTTWPLKKVCKVNLLEDDLEVVPWENGRFTVELKPFEVASYRLVLA